MCVCSQLNLGKTFFSPLCLLLSLCEVAGTLGGEPGELTGLGEPELPLEPDKSYSGGHVFVQERELPLLELGRGFA